MSLLCVGSVALDTLEGPFGRHEDVLGGAASFFSTAASFFAPVSLVAVVGADFPEAHVEFLAGRGIDTRGLARAAGRTFRWGGRYSDDLARRETIFTELGVFEVFDPTLPDGYRDAPFVFLANIDPDLQRRVLEQARAPRFVAADTMNFWIGGKREALLKTLARVDLLVINDEEARQLAEDSSLLVAATRIRAMGPRSVVIKRGDAGAVLYAGEEIFAVPGYPLENAVDPTGAGDAFAGGLMGTVARAGSADAETLRRAVVYGSVMGSLAVEGLGLDRLIRLRASEIEERFARFRELVRFA
ncbi:MAG: PfkB family carbohydrate kinase [Myxococcota bacterium]